MKKILIGVIVLLSILLSIWIQINIINEYPLFGTVANVGIVLVVGIGLMCGKIPGIAIGVIYGLFIDIVFGRTLGINTTLYLVIGAICGYLNGGFSKDNKMSVIMMVFLMTIAFEICAYLIALMLYNYEPNLITTVIIIVKESIYNILVTLVMYKVIIWLSEIINKGKSTYYSMY